MNKSDGLILKFFSGYWNKNNLLAKYKGAPGAWGFFKGLSMGQKPHSHLRPTMIKSQTSLPTCSYMDQTVVHQFLSLSPPHLYSSSHSPHWRVLMVLFKSSGGLSSLCFVILKDTGRLNWESRFSIISSIQIIVHHRYIICLKCTVPAKDPNVSEYLH